MSEQPTLRECQINALINMLHFNDPTQMSAAITNTITSSQKQRLSPSSSNADLNQPLWKVLIYDQAGKDIISPLLKVNDLREQGITIHMQIDSIKQSIPDVPAIYFLEPTIENIEKICKDLLQNLYETYYISFISSIPRPVLEEFATKVASAQTNNLISKVYDQYLNFISLEQNLFSLNFSNAYFELNNPRATDQHIQQCVDRIVNSLFSVFVTLEKVPIIKCSRGNAAELIAEKLDSKLKDHLIARNSIFSESTTSGVGYQRPVLILLDRNMDLTTMLQHTWVYHAFIHDTFELKLNRIIIPPIGEDKKRKVFELDVNDFFWKKYSGNPFPEVAEEIDNALTEYKKDAEGITKLNGASGLDDVNQIDLASNAKHLKSALSALPELTQRKAIIDMHMTIATALLNTVKERELDQYFTLEEEIHKTSKSAILETLLDPKKGNSEDKLRLFLLYFMSGEQEITKDDTKEFLTALDTAGCQPEYVNRILSYIQKLRALNRTTTATDSYSSSSQSGDLLGKFSSIGNKLTTHLRETSGNSYVDTLLSGVKNTFLLPTTHSDTMVTKVVESIMDHQQPNLTEDYLTFDPKLGRQSRLTRPTHQNTQSSSNFTEAVVFVVGGGNYAEYQNLMEFAKRPGATKKSITYGSTDMTTSRDFLQQLEKLYME